MTLQIVSFHDWFVNIFDDTTQHHKVMRHRSTTLW